MLAVVLKKYLCALRMHKGIFKGSKYFLKKEAYYLTVKINIF